MGEEAGQAKDTKEVFTTLKGFQQRKIV